MATLRRNAILERVADLTEQLKNASPPESAQIASELAKTAEIAADLNRTASNYSAFYQLEVPDAEQKTRDLLDHGEEVQLLGIGLRYEDDRLVVRVPSSARPDRISSGSAFEDMSRAEALLYVAQETDWVARLMAERPVELQLTDSNGKVWWRVPYGHVQWPAAIQFPIRTSARWVA